MHLFCFFLTLLRRLTKMLKAHVFSAVVRCAAEQRAILHRFLAGSKHAYSVLALSIGRETEQPPDTQRRVPGKVGDALAFRQATVIQFKSTPTGKSPQPTGMKQQAVKIVPKATEVLAVRVSRTFSSKELWESFEKTPQKCIVQWLADRHVNALDSFAWKAEKGDAQGTPALWPGQIAEVRGRGRPSCFWSRRDLLGPDTVHEHQEPH